jgi:hypothetical protein
MVFCPHRVCIPVASCKLHERVRGLKIRTACLGCIVIVADDFIKPRYLFSDRPVTDDNWHLNQKGFDEMFFARKKFHQTLFG